MIDAIMNTATYNKFYDEIFKVGLGERTNDTVSNVPRFYHHHRLQYLDMTTYDREKEKRKVFLNIAAQVTGTLLCFLMRMQICLIGGGLPIYAVSVRRDDLEGELCRARHHYRPVLLFGRE